MTVELSQPTPQPVVVDTNVVSFLFKRDTRAQAYERLLVGKLPVISFMTLAELDSWADIRGWGAVRREELRKFLSHYVVQYPDRNLCQLWGSVVATARRAGRPIDSADAWIAATALL